MALSHSLSARGVLADAVCGLLDVASANGQLVMQTNAGAAVATLGFSKPAFLPASSGVAASGPITADNNAVGGTIAQAVAQDGNGTPVFTCAVTAVGGGGDIELDSVNVSAGQTVSLTGLTYTAPQ